MQRAKVPYRHVNKWVPAALRIGAVEQVNRRNILKTKASGSLPKACRDADSDSGGVRKLSIKSDRSAGQNPEKIKKFLLTFYKGVTEIGE
jgi:hypothetical protein